MIVRSFSTSVIVLGSLLSACAEPGEPPDDVESIAATLPDIDGALKRIYLGDDAYSDMQRGQTTPLTVLVKNSDSAATAWLRAYQRTPTEELDRRSALLFLAGNACLDGLVKPLAAIADTERKVEFAPMEFCQGEAPPDLPLAPFAVKAIGSITGEQCAELGSDPQNVELAISLLTDWVKQGDNGVHLAAAEQLLTHQPGRAAQLRPQLNARRAILLEPMEERRFEPYVEDSGPRQPSAETLARYDECDPQREYSNACEPPYDFSIDPGRGGDTFIQERIASNASEGGEDCVAFTSRYHNEVGFQYNTWDDGFGVGDPCNPEKPYGRAMNAVWLLEQSSFNNPPGDRSDGVIHWAYDYVKSVTPEIEGNCSDDAMASYTGGFWCDQWPWCDERIELQANFHRVSLPVRVAGGFLHEARHADGYSHDAGSDCPRGRSCDSSYSYRGPHTLSIQWLAQFARIGRHSTSLLRESALEYANHLLRTQYRTCPNFSLGPDGYFETGSTTCD